jgi:hypothetical protein
MDESSSLNACHPLTAGCRLFRHRDEGLTRLILIGLCPPPIRGLVRLNQGRVNHVFAQEPDLQFIGEQHFAET